MATSPHLQNSLLTEHFRYTPLTLLDDIINTVNELVFRAINAIEQGMSDISPEALGFKLPAGEASASAQIQRTVLHDLKQNEIDKGVIQLESLLNATVDKDFDKFEIYTLRNILAVGHAEDGDLAKWVRLEHYKDVDIDTSRNSPTPEQVQLRRRKLQETRKLNSMLKQEEARNAAVLDQMRKLTGVGLETPAGAVRSDPPPLAFLTSSPHTSQTPTSQPLTQDVQYALSQLPALRQLLSQLKGSLQTSPNSGHTEENTDSTDVRRREYLDAQSKRAVAKRGIDTDLASKAVSGRKIARDEVQALESIVQALDGGKSGTGDEMEES
nr:kinetochore-associated protein mtw1 [Quercus suber]